MERPGSVRDEIPNLRQFAPICQDLACCFDAISISEYESSTAMAVDGGCIFGPNVEAIQEADVSKCPGAPQKLITDGYSQGRERDNKFNIALQNVKHKTQDGLQENHMES